MKKSHEVSRPATQTKHPNEGEPIMRSAADRINPSQTPAWHARTAPVMMWILVFALGLTLAPHAGAGDKPNVIIQTDIHPTDGEPDDKQSLIRFLLEANEFNILGLIATDRSPEQNQQSLDRIHEVIDAYEEVFPNLVKHASGYPTADYLRSVATIGTSKNGSLRRIVTSGAVVNLSAAGSTDPDGDSLTYRWWHYPEPSTYKKPLEISGANSRDASFVAPNVASTQTIHIILDVTDTGSHAGPARAESGPMSRRRPKTRRAILTPDCPRPRPTTTAFRHSDESITPGPPL